VSLRSSSSARRLRRSARARARLEPLESRVCLAVTLPAAADTFVRDGDFDDANFGAADRLLVRDGDNEDRAVAYLKFDLGGVTSVESATLFLTGALDTGDELIVAGVYPVSDTSWAEGDGADLDGENEDQSGAMTWDNRPDVGGDPLAETNFSGEVFQVYSWDVTDYLRQELDDGESVISVAIRTRDEANGFARFVSRSAGDGAPQLVIEEVQTPADTAPPSANVSAPNVTAAGGSPQTVTVTYADPSSVDASSVGPDDITVAGPGGTLNVTGVNRSPDSNSPQIVATYTVEPAGGEWDSNDNGAYTVTLNGGQVRDTVGNGVAEAQASFQVNVAAPDTAGPSASISVGNINSAGGNTHTIRVTYSDATAVDAGTINTGDIIVQGPGGGSLNVIGASADPNQDGPTLVATYTVEARGGSWDHTDTGDYSVTLKDGEVRDTAGNDASAAGAGFRVDIANPDTGAPSASIAVGNINSPGGTSHAAVVTYTDDRAVSFASIGPNDLSVTDPNGQALEVTGLSVEPSGGADGSPLVVTYTFAARGGSWDNADNGTYTVAVRPDQVRDPAGNAVSPASRTFQVGVDAPDTTGPSASVSAPNVTTFGAETHAVTVVYIDDDMVDASTIDRNDIRVEDPGGGTLEVLDANVSGGDGKTRTATYTVRARGGAWGPLDNGNYTVTLRSNEVRDVSGNAALPTSTSFNVNVTAPDTEGPSANISAPGVGSAGGGTHAITVVYTDNGAVDASTIGTDDIEVDGPGDDLEVIGVSVDPAGNGQTRTATYVVRARGGSWDHTDNGNYTVSLRGDRVSDTAGNAARSAESSFSVNIAVPPPADNDAPEARIFVDDVDDSGESTHRVRVLYEDDRGMDTGTIGGDDLSVTGPGGALGVAGVDVETSDGGRRALVTYTFTAPGGSWDAADNGNYSVVLAGGAVRDTGGNGVGGEDDSFKVDIEIRDDDGPAAAISAPTVEVLGATTQTVTVVYSDISGVKVSTIDEDDIVVSRNGGGPALEVIDVDVSRGDNGSPVTATYTLAAPGGTWGPADNGTYTIAMRDGEVEDTRGNESSAASAAFAAHVVIVDNSGPSAAIVSAPGVTSPGDRTQTIVVAYADDVAVDLSSIGVDDLAVNGPAGALAVTVVNVSSAADGKSAVVGYTFSAPAGGWNDAHNGNYSVTLNGGAVRDTSGKGVPGASASFAVNVPKPAPIDPGFGGGAPVNTPFVAEAVATQPDGRIVVAGRQGNPRDGSAQAVLQRFNADGTLDTTFGQGGKVVSDADGGDDVYYALLIQGDNRILAAGTSGGNFVITRYDFAGRVDNDFGRGGRAVTDIGAGDDAVYGIAFGPNNSVVAAGRSNGNFAFARYDASGNFDAGFGAPQVDLGSANDAPGAVAVQPDGRVVAAGVSGSTVAIVRLLPDGQVDNSFSGDGVLRVTGLTGIDDPNSPDRSAALTLQPDGRILVANRTPDGNYGVVRIEQNGNVDSSFGSDGLATIDFGGEDDADSLIVQDTGEIIAVGTSLSGGRVETGVAALDESGRPIAGYGDAGRLTFEPGVAPLSREVHIGDLVLRSFGTRQPDGRLVIGTSDQSPTTTSSALRRVNVPGTRAQPRGESLGSFGLVNGRSMKLAVKDMDGTMVTLSLKGGTATAFQSGDRITLVVNVSSSSGATVSIKCKGGDRRVTLGDVIVSGTLKSLSCKTADLMGTMFVDGSVGKLTLGNVTGGMIASSRSMKSVSVGSLSNARLLAGMNLGADGELGGGDDGFGQGSITSLKVGGSIAASIIAAGLDPMDGTFGNGDDRVVGGEASLIKSVSSKRAADDATRFIAGKFGKAKLGGKVNVATDPRFRLL
jgi:uncharacterized delta-60 repeat protein